MQSAGSQQQGQTGARHASDEPPLDVLIIGAGMAGLTAAGRLADAGRRVLLLDKGRHPGGRMAMRRLHEEDLRREGVAGTALAQQRINPHFNYGAGRLHASHSPLQQRIQRWSEDGLLRPCAQDQAESSLEWRFARTGDTLAEPTEGMRNLALSLAEGLDVRTDCRILEVRETERGWWARSMLGEIYEAKALLITTPLPQALQMVTAGRVYLPSGLWMQLERVQYRSIFSLMLLAEAAPVTVTLDGEGDGPSLGTLLPQPVAPEGTPLHPFVLHSSQDYTERRLEDDPEAVLLDLEARLQAQLPGAVHPVKLQRWRYAQVVRGLALPYLLAGRENSLAFAGDAFVGAGDRALSGVEAAACSGDQVAQALLQ